MDIIEPEHLVDMKREEIPGDLGGYFPDRDSAKKYWSNPQTNLAIQADRILAIKTALNQVESKNILDFGIGDGVRFKNLQLIYDKLTGIDISEDMIELCKKNLNKKNLTHDLKVGNQDSLDDIPSDTFDLVLLIHVLGYIPESEHDKLFRNLNRILLPGGKLLVSSGNKLFDLFALNSGTKNFFESEFGVSNSELLLTTSNSKRFKNAGRINPLSFSQYLIRYGFEEINQTFSQYHHIPPQILVQLGATIEDARLEARSNNVDANKFSDLDRWKAYFQCSVIVSLSVANKLNS